MRSHIRVATTGLLWTMFTVIVALAASLSFGILGVAGATTTTTDLDAALKVIFDDAIVNSVVTDSELLDIFEDGSDQIRTDQTTGGRYIELAHQFALPGGVRASTEGGYIPVPGGPLIVNGRVSLKKVMGTVELTAESLKRVRTNKGAFLDWSKQQLPQLVKRVTNELDRMLLGYGSGIKSRVNVTIATNTITIDSPFGVTSLSSQALNRATLQHLHYEFLRASPNANGTSPRTGTMRVDSIDHANSTITVDAAAAALADNDYLFLGDANVVAAAIDPMGLMGMVDDGTILTTLQNISRTTYPQWKAYVHNAQAAVLTEEVLLEADDEAAIQGGGNVNVVIASRASVRAVWRDLKGDRAINDPRGYLAGMTGVTVLFGTRSIMLKSPRKLPDQIVLGLTRSTFRKWLLHKWEWDDTTGSIWKQVTDGTGRKDAFYAYGSLYSEYGCNDPQQNWRVQNYTLSA